MLYHQEKVVYIVLQHLGICRERGVASHQEVKSWSGDQRGNHANEIIVHVARVSQRGGGGGHHCGHLVKDIMCINIMYSK